MAHFWGCRVCAPDGLLLVCGQDRDGAARGGARKLLLGHAQRVRGGTGDGRQIVSQDSPYGVSRIGGQAGTQDPDPTPVSRQNREAGPEGPEALSTVSLPTMGRASSGCLVRSDCTERLVLRRHDCKTAWNSPGLMRA
jgi:hypothetical protein